VASLHPAILLLAGAAVLPLLPRRVQTVLFLAVPAAVAVLVHSLEHGILLEWSFYGYDITPLRVDRLSVPFAYVFLLITFLGGVYGLRLMGTGERVAALAYAGSAVGVAFAGDLLTLFVFWELKVVTSVFLIWARRTPAADGAGLRYLFVHLTGGVVLLGGILWHIAETGSIAFVAFGPGSAGWLVLGGFLLSAAVPPLHAWLSDAYPEATVPGMVFLAAFTTKAGVYALARGFPGVEMLVWLGVAMALYGVVYAVLENDIRRLLAYHIVSQVGYMVAAVGIGTPTAISGATAHAFAHILYKGLLLMGAGAVLHATGRSKLTELGGLARSMPVVLVLYMVGAFSISAVPLFSGFVSKEIIVHAAGIDGREAVVWLLKLASIGTFLHTGLKLPYFTWYGPDRGITPRPVPMSMYVAMGLTAGINIAIGVVPSLLHDGLPFPIDWQPYTAGKVTELVHLLLFTAFGFWVLRAKLGGEPTVSIDTDWFYRDLPHRLEPAAAGLLQRGTAVGERVRTLGAGAGRSVSTRAPLRYVRRAGGSAAGVGGERYPTWFVGGVVVVTFVVVLGLSYVARVTVGGP
jgi:multicomponent Na+:H+ antiporter subunit D